MVMSNNSEEYVTIYMYMYFFTACVNNKFQDKYDMKTMNRSLNQKCRDAKPDITIE